MQGVAAPATTDQPQYIITPADKERLKAIAAAWDAYHGKLKPPLKPMPDEADDNVMVNVCLPIVEAGTDFLFGQELELSVGKNDPQEAKDFLDLVWGKKEQRMPLLQKLHTNGALCRNAFLRKVPGNVKPGQEQAFRLVVLDPATVYIETAPGDVETVLCYCIQYSTTKVIEGRPQQVYSREEIRRIDPDGNALSGEPDDDDTWGLQKWYQVGTSGMEPRDGKWIADGPPIEWDYPFPPVRHCQNMPLPNDAWGMPDITPGIIGLNNALNLASSCANRNNKLLGHPILAASGIADSDISLTPGHVNITAPDGKFYSVAITSDIPASLALIEELRGNVDQESHVPGVASGRMKELPRLQSGVAVELMYQTLIMKNTKKRCTYGELIIDTSKDLLVLNGMSGDIDISLPWQSPLPHDDLQAVQAAVMKKQIGISNQTLMREEGYDPDEEMELSQEEDAASMTAFSRGQGMPPTMSGQPPTQPVQPAQQQESPFVGRSAGQ